MNLNQKTPVDFEVVVDYDGAISEVYYDGKRLSDVLPTLYEVSASVDCTDVPNRVQLTCYGEARFVYRDVEQTEIRNDE